LTPHKDNDGQVQTSVGEAVRHASGLLADLLQASARLEAELLLCQATGLDRTRLLGRPETKIGHMQLTAFQRLVRRRLAGEPIAYILGHREFWTLDLTVTPDTLIPRPETELLVELALENLPPDAPLLLLDAGTGSGAVAAALATERPAWTLIAIDRNMEAARVAWGNLRTCGLGNSNVVVCDWLAPIAEGSLNAVVANPPYISARDPHLRLGDLPWEPQNALVSGNDGLCAIRILSKQAAGKLRPESFIALEHGFDQGPAVREILAGQGFQAIATHRDLSGQERVSTGHLAA
jgi:release factor glutamine methyltransferase